MIEGLEMRRLLAAYVNDPGFAKGGAFGGPADDSQFTDAAFARGGKVTVVQGEGIGPDGGGPYNYTVERFHGDGTVDRSFAPIGNYSATFAQDAEGYIYVAAGTTLTRYTPRGKVDRSFGHHGHVDVAAAVDQPAALDQIFFSGTGTIYVTLTRKRGSKHIELRLAQLSTDGTVQTGYGDGGSAKLGTGGDSAPNLLLATGSGPGGRVYFSTAAADGAFTRITALTANGDPDAHFGTGGVLTPADPPAALAVDATGQPTGRLLVLTTSTRAAAVTRYDYEGKLDTTFAAHGTATLAADPGYAPDDVEQLDRTNALLAQPDGTLYAQANERIYRLTDTGAADTSFDGDGMAELPGRARVTAVLDGAFLTTDGQRLAPAANDARTADGVLNVYGDGGADSVTVRLEKKNIRVSVNGVVTRVPLAGTSQVNVNLLGGDDVLSYALDVPGTLDVGGGDDRVSASGPFVTVLPGGGENTIAFGSGGGEVDVPAFGTATVGHSTITGHGGVLNVSIQNGSTAGVNFTGKSASIFTDSGNLFDRPQGGSDVRLDVTDASTVHTGAGDDRIDASASTGSIYVNPGTGRDTVKTGSGNDQFVSAPDTVPAGEGDSVDLGAGNDVARDTDGDNTLSGGDGNDSITTGDGNDLLRGNAGADTLDGGAGRDTLYGMTGNDSLLGGAGNDTIYAGEVNQRVPSAVNHIDGGGGTDAWQREGDGDTAVSVEGVL